MLKKMKKEQSKTLFVKGGREVEKHNHRSSCRGQWIMVGWDNDDSPWELYACWKHKVSVIRQWDSADYKYSTYRTEALKFFNEKTGYFEIDENWDGRVVLH